MNEAATGFDGSTPVTVDAICSMSAKNTKFGKSGLVPPHGNVKVASGVDEEAKTS